MTSFSREEIKDKASSLAIISYLFLFSPSWEGPESSACHAVAEPGRLLTLPGFSLQRVTLPLLCCTCSYLKPGSNLSHFLFQTLVWVSSSPSTSPSLCLPWPLTRPTASISSGRSTARSCQRSRASRPKMWPSGLWKRWVTCPAFLGGENAIVLLCWRAN